LEFANSTIAKSRKYCTVYGGSQRMSLCYSSTLQCIRAMECEYALCSLFAPGDRHVIIGTKVRLTCTTYLIPVLYMVFLFQIIIRVQDLYSPQTEAVKLSSSCASHLRSTGCHRSIVSHKFACSPT